VGRAAHGHKTGTVNLFGNSYEVDPRSSVGESSSSSTRSIWKPSRSASRADRWVSGAARHRRHSHPRVAKDPEPPPMPTGIDYLALIEARHSEEMAKRIVLHRPARWRRPERGGHGRHRHHPPASWDHRHRPAHRYTRGTAMSIELLRAHYGFSKMPFGKDVAPGRCIATPPLEAVARVGSSSRSPRRGCSPAKSAPARPWLFGPRSPGSIRRAIPSSTSPTRRSAWRGMHAAIVSALGGVPRFHAAALVPRRPTSSRRSPPAGKKVILAVDEAHLLSPSSSRGYAC